MSAHPPARICWPMVMTVVFWGYNFVALKLVNNQMTPMALGLVRWVLGMAGMVILCLIIRVPLKVEKKDFPLAFVQGLFSMGLYMIVFLQGASMTSPAEAAIILATAPIFTALCAAAFRQEKLNPLLLGWAVVAFAGVALVVIGGAAGFGEKGQSHLAGNLLLLLSSALWAVSATLSRPLVIKYSPFTTLTVSMWGALPVWLVFGIGPSLATEFGAFTSVTWVHLFFIVVFAGILGFVGFYAGVSRIGAPGAMLYQYCVPPVAAIFSFLVLRTGLAPLQFLGFALILFGVVMANRARARGAAKLVEPVTSTT
ncbi:MAG: DMT family transporter [Fimbriimonadaceae bacterium]|nr:DMT family transporter [Fimbriimonadaceae bacterium]